jgi:hypothetical protein
MERYFVLLIAIAIQIGSINEEAYRRVSCDQLRYTYKGLTMTAFPLNRLPFYQDKLHEETVFRRFTEILAKARANKSSNKPETELNEFEAVCLLHSAVAFIHLKVSVALI